MTEYLDGNIITPKNINSCYFDLINKVIFIFRKEEFEKVLLHEIIHLQKLDKDVIFKSNIKILEFENFDEAYTDYLAIIYHLIYISFIINKSVSSLFAYEFAFIKNQAQFLNNYFNLGDWTTKQTVNQKSSAFSYYIVKYFIFLNNGKTNITVDKFINEKYIDFKSMRMTLFSLQP